MMSDWKPIETAPKDGTSVLLWRTNIDGSDGRVTVGSWHETYGGSWWDEGMEYTFDHMTHWRPLPAPPASSPKEPT